MTRTSRLLTAALLSTALVASACHYQKRNLTLSVTNQSTRMLNNVEVDYPGGIFGFSMLGTGKSFQRQIVEASPCKLVVHFDGLNGRQQTQNFDLGRNCPEAIRFTYGQEGLFHLQGAK